jgi:hypothetical protein
MPERRTTDPATDQTTKHDLDTERVVVEPEKKSWLDLSFIQVVGGALAAMTAAALGSRFSVEGTVVGAALASVIAAVASALYTTSLRRTQEAVRVVVGGRRNPAAGTGSSSASPRLPTGSTAVSPDPLPQPATAADPTARIRRRRTVLVSSVVGALATFALAAGALTTYEALAGRALSGGDGTTISQVQREGPKNDRPADEDSPAPTESADPAESSDPTATAEPSAEPSVTEESEPRASAPTTEPTEEPSAEPSATAQAEPSATVAQPTTAPSQIEPSR